MPAGSMLARSNVAEPAVVSHTASVVEARAESSPLPQVVSLPNTAHRAVEAVLDVTERFTSREQHSVNLQFSVGGNDLNVRVELRGGEVHTTFKTDSSELRAALSSEWQSVTSPSGGDRPVKLASPVFAPADGAGTSFTGEGSARHRDAQPDTHNATFTFTRAPHQAKGMTAASGAVRPAERLVAANSLHLHTLA